MSVGVDERNMFRYSCGCEILMGQPYEFYKRCIQNQVIDKINMNQWHILISGLDRGVYRPAFGTPAHLYMEYFDKTEKEIVELLKTQGVSCITTMMLYDHSKRFVMIFSLPDGFTAQDAAEIVASCFNRLYAQIYDMSQTPYRNYTALSQNAGGYENLTKVFKETDALSRQQYFDMRTMVMTPSLLESLRVPADPEEIHEELMRMYVAMRAGETAEMLERYHAVMGRLERARDFDLLADALSSMRRTLEGVLRSHGIEPNEQMRDIFAIENHPTFQIQRDRIENCLRENLARIGDSRPMSQLIQEAVRFIRHHYAENLSVADIAEHIGMSQSWLTKRFKQECGCNILSCLLSVRVERAKALLVETDMLILEIASACGFDNPGYFISVFRKEVGMTPKAYREEYKK